MKNCSRRLRVEAQIAERGHVYWEDILLLSEVFPYFKDMYFQYSGKDIVTLRSMMCEDGYKLSYESYVEMFSEFVGEYLYRYSKDSYKQIMFE